MIKFMNSGNERHLPVVQRIKFCLFLIKIHSLIPNEVALVSKINLKSDDFETAQNLNIFEIIVGNSRIRHGTTLDFE